MGRTGMLIGFWWESQKEKIPLGRITPRCEDNINMVRQDKGALCVIKHYAMKTYGGVEV
jgi:hypothetical protein